MKQFLLLVFAIITIIPLSACGEKNTNNICAADSCENPCFGKYCIYHNCSEFGCDNIRTVVSGWRGTSGYCDEHKCEKDDCNYGKESPSRYCSSHTCFTTNCTNMVNAQFEHCSEHACIVDSCTNPRLYDSDYCARHTCSVEGCKNIQFVDYCNFCVEHKCDVTYCPRMRPSETPYCETHTCNYDGCNNRSPNANYCSSHDYLLNYGPSLH